MAAAYLLVIGDREALGWVLAEQRIAFPSPNRREVRALSAGDRLYLYMTRRCLKNPTRDRGRVIGVATAASATQLLEQPVEFGGRTFPAGCRLSISELVPFGTGPVLAEFADELETLRDAGRAWSVKLRRPLVPLNAHDVTVLDRRLEGLTTSRDEVITPYLRWYQPA
ncbi:hypothetical protein [Georgenia muralis]